MQQLLLPRPQSSLTCLPVFWVVAHNILRYSIKCMFLSSSSSQVHQHSLALDPQRAAKQGAVSSVHRKRHKERPGVLGSEVTG